MNPKAKNWLAEKLNSAPPEPIRRMNHRTPPPPAATLSLLEQWVAEAEAARAGAEWFASWHPVGRARWAASMLGIADDDALDVADDLRAWLADQARGYQE
jgi:hypothetical protein